MNSLNGRDRRRKRGLGLRWRRRSDQCCWGLRLSLLSSAVKLTLPSLRFVIDVDSRRCWGALPVVVQERSCRWWFRLLADPKFLHRLAIEEAISITTTLLAQYERRKENFFEELDYVITDTVRGTVVDFFTVWLPAPTLSFLSLADEIDTPDSMETLKGLLGFIPDNAFQKNFAGKDWNLSHRVASVLVGGLKLASVGFISSIGAVAASNILYAIRRLLNPAVATNQQNKRSPIFKTALVYGGFLGTSANLRYQVIAGLVEHRFSDQFASQTLLVNMLSFLVRTINSYWGTQQWVDLARFTGLQTRKSETPSYQTPDSPNHAALECNNQEEASIDEIKNQ
uniref:Uncharacterized protein n=1 Tax=Davidia involucrata TaxID=16924 RepID=A0A5B6ZMM4_DAVIN